VHVRMRCWEAAADGAGCPAIVISLSCSLYETGEADTSGRLWRCDCLPLPWEADMAECRRGSSHAPSIDAKKR